MAALSPRVNKAFMPRYLGDIVRVVCRVVGYNQEKDTLTVETSDGGRVAVAISPDTAIYPVGSVLEIIGRVEDDGASLQMFNLTPFNDDFDFENFERLLRLTHKFPSIFSTRQ